MALHVTTLPAHVPFADTLARGLLKRYGETPEALAEVVLFLPTQRACMTVREALITHSSQSSLLLPSMLALGELDAARLMQVAPESLLKLAPVLPARQRLLVLAQLVARWSAATKNQTTSDAYGQALPLAQKLTDLLDEWQREEVDPQALQRLVPEPFAAHWQETLQFLRILTHAWPAILAERARIDPVAHRNAIAGLYAQHLPRIFGSRPVIAAGSTGSVPSTARLLKAIAALPQGCVILPGLDTAMDADSWQAVPPSHPQYGLKQLLDQLGVERSTVTDWEPEAEKNLHTPARTQLWQEVMRPAAQTHLWHETKLDATGAAKGLEAVTCQSPQEEATVIALRLRAHLENPGPTAMVVTHDRALAQRIKIQLQRWDIALDDSAGVPLAQTPLGRYFTLIAEMVASDGAPVPLLALCKHPFVHNGDTRSRALQNIRTIELLFMRGLWQYNGLFSLLRHIKRTDGLHAEYEWIERMINSFHPLHTCFQRRSVCLGDLLNAQVAVAEALADAPDRPGRDRLWQQPEGDVLREILTELEGSDELNTLIAPHSWPAVLRELMAGAVVRPHLHLHPRLRLLSPMEARMQHADLIILAGLNEGSWPPRPVADPFTNRAMREMLGLPDPERKTGQAAHDFVQLASAPQVMLTRATQTDDGPARPCRWWLKMEALLTMYDAKAALENASTPWRSWARMLDEPEALRPVSPPAPCPPVEARPRQLSVTQVERLMRDPYGVYAAHILKLRPLEPVDKAPGPAEFGALVHSALEQFTQAAAGLQPDDYEAVLLEAGKRTFRALQDRPSVYALWWPRYRRIAAWMASWHRGQAANIRTMYAEVSGALELPLSNGETISLTARADRIDRLRDGTLGIVDYKTGGAPSWKQMEQGFAPQLCLEALIAEAGGFSFDNGGNPAREQKIPNVSMLQYFEVRGGEPPVVSKAYAISRYPDLIKETHEGVVRLLSAFMHTTTPYHACPRPTKAPRHNDYAHLERIQEWGKRA